MHACLGYSLIKVRFINTSSVTRSNSCSRKNYSYASGTSFCIKNKYFRCTLAGVFLIEKLLKTCYNCCVLVYIFGRISKRKWLFSYKNNYSMGAPIHAILLPIHA